MQYKIPVKIENEDPIVIGLSIRQLIIIFGFGGVSYAIFGALEPIVQTQIALIPAIILVPFGILVATFNFSEMTFMVFILSWIRLFVNQKERYWQKGIDSFSAIEIGYITNVQNKVEKVDFGNKIDKIKQLEDKLEKI